MLRSAGFSAKNTQSGCYSGDVCFKVYDESTNLRIHIISTLTTCISGTNVPLILANSWYFQFVNWFFSGTICVSEKFSVEFQ